MKFILITKQPLTDNTVNITSNAFYDGAYQEVFETVNLDALKEVIKIPPKAINIKLTGKYLTEILLKAITPAYLRGTQITINNISYPVCTSNPQYFYLWQEKLPSSLPEHLKTAYRNRNLRNDLYNELIIWNQSRIQKAQKASEFKWNLAEEFYKQVYKTLTPKHIRVQSPNAKTFYESTAEIYLESFIPDQAPLTRVEIEFLSDAQAHNYTRAFGLQDCDFMIGTHHHTTKHGTTEEPYLTNRRELEQIAVANVFNRKEGRSVDGYKNDDGFEVKRWSSSSAYQVTSVSRQRENIETLKYFLSLDKDTQAELLMPGWHFCPECGHLYHENDGCYDGDTCHIREITFVPYNENHDDEEEYAE